MRLLIYGSGGNGCEICDLALYINAHSNRWDAIDFVDDVRQERYWYGRTVYRFDELVAEKSQCECVISLGEPAYRRMLYKKLQDSRVPLATLVHPDARVSPSCTLGAGCIVETGSLISSNSHLQDNIMIEINTIIGHDVTLSSHSVISSGTIIGSNTKVGEDCFIGLNCSIRDHISIGNHCIIGMGSALFQSIDDDIIAIGNPARPVRRNEDKRVFK